MQRELWLGMRRTLNRLAPLLTVVMILLVWEAACYLFAIREFVLPSPSAIVRAAQTMDGEDWVLHVVATLRVALAGFLVSLVISIPLAVVLALSPMLSRSVYPILVVIQTTPIVAVAPIIALTLGIGEVPRIVIAAIISFFPLVISTTTGVLSTPQELLELSRSLRANRFREVMQIRLPYAVPHIFSALKVSITLAIVGAVVAEFVAGDRGLGYAILYTTSQYQSALAFATLGALVITSLILFYIITFAQSLFFPWSLPQSTAN